MAEYIKREDALEITTRTCGDYAAAWAEIRKLPAADVEPVVRGRWNDSYDGITPYCSVCGHSHRLMVRKPNYCPNCGAKMDLEGENE